MPKAIQIPAHGGPEQMQLVDIPVGDPGPGEIRIRHHACGLNFIDVYQRSGMYPMPLPAVLGMEGAGMVETVGEGVSHLQAGDRAAYASNPPGSYCEARVMPAAQVCKLPDAVSFEQGAAMMLQGLTVQYLFKRTTPLKAGDTVLFHAAAGGVGLIACQWARAMGIELIGTAGSDEKCALAKSYGATHVINYRTQDFVAEVKRLTGGAGVRAVMDSVGKDTWEGSLDSLRPLGIMISFGAASGPVPPLDVASLGKRGSLHVTRPTLFTHVAQRETCQDMADDLFQMVASGQIEIRIDQRFPLADAAEAHRALEARKTTGATILLP
ncbi:MAG: quinone oxidoreductase [Rhodobacteraceae bacterium]|nr:quinone oxidoreductase [Paracoccaceae bacterium]